MITHYNILWCLMCFFYHCSCMQGYINDTLSTAFLTHTAVEKDFTTQQMVTDSGLNVTQCRYEKENFCVHNRTENQWPSKLKKNFVLLCVCSYRDYRSDEDYTLTSQFWLVFAVRFAFVILFEVCIPDLLTEWLLQYRRRLLIDVWVVCVCVFAACCCGVQVCGSLVCPQ